MRRATQEAVEGGYDRVAWATGRQAADATDQLLQDISRIEYNQTEKSLRAFDLGGEGTMMQYNVTPEMLPDIIGKEPARRLMQQKETVKPYDTMQYKGTVKPPNLEIYHEGDSPFREYQLQRERELGIRETDVQVFDLVNDDTGEILGEYATREEAESAMELFASTHYSQKIQAKSGTRTIKNTDFEGGQIVIGSTGMVGYYDDIMPKAVKKYGKQVGGIEIEEIDLDVMRRDDFGDDFGYYEEYNNSFAVTPEMRRIVGEGDQRLWGAAGLGLVAGSRQRDDEPDSTSSRNGIRSIPRYQEGGYVSGKPLPKMMQRHGIRSIPRYQNGSINGGDLDDQPSPEWWDKLRRNIDSFRSRFRNLPKFRISEQKRREVEDPWYQEKSGPLVDSLQTLLNPVPRYRYQSDLFDIPLWNMPGYEEKIPVTFRAEHPDRGGEYWSPDQKGYHTGYPEHINIFPKAGALEGSPDQDFLAAHEKWLRDTAIHEFGHSLDPTYSARGLPGWMTPALWEEIYSAEAPFDVRSRVDYESDKPGQRYADFMTDAVNFLQTSKDPRIDPNLTRSFLRERPYIDRVVEELLQAQTYQEHPINLGSLGGDYQEDSMQPMSHPYHSQFFTHEEAARKDDMDRLRTELMEQFQVNLGALEEGGRDSAEALTLMGLESLDPTKFLAQQDVTRIRNIQR